MSELEDRIKELEAENTKLRLVAVEMLGIITGDIPTFSNAKTLEWKKLLHYPEVNRATNFHIQAEAARKMTVIPSNCPTCKLTLTPTPFGWECLKCKTEIMLG